MRTESSFAVGLHGRRPLEVCGGGAVIDLRKSCGRGEEGERATGNQNSGEGGGSVEEGCKMKGMYTRVLS